MQGLLPELQQTTILQLLALVQLKESLTLQLYSQVAG